MVNPREARRGVPLVLAALVLACGDDASDPPLDAARSDASLDAALAATDAGARRDAAPPPLDAAALDAAAPADAASAVDAAADSDAGSEDDAGSAPEVPRFVDVTAVSGLAYDQAPIHVDDPLDDDWYDTQGLTRDAAFMTGGAAAADYDGDGDPDLYVTRLHAPGILFRNRGDRTFEDATTGSGLDVPGFRTVGAAWGDIDNDGDPDLFVTTLQSGRFLLFVNDGDGTFTEDAVARGVALADGEPHQGYGASFGDFDRDGWLDLHTTEWQNDLDTPAVPSHSRLFRNLGAMGPGSAGTFEDVTIAAGVSVYNAGPGAMSFASNLSDLDDDGYPELLVASDFGTSRLFANDGDGTFTDVTAAAGVGTDENGMGSAVGDYDGDGLLDWFVTSIHCAQDDFLCPLTGNRLYRNDGDGTFSDHTDVAGVRDGRWGWGTTFFELDGDGDLDLVMTNGIRFLYMGFGPFFNDPVRLWENTGGGTMTERSRAYDLVDHGDGKGLLVLDFDGDGDEDVFLVNHVTGGKLYENRVADVAGHGWLRLRLVGATANRSAFGARVRLERRNGAPVQLRELVGGNNFLGQNEPIVHFGLGPGTDPIYRVEITWPNPGTRKIQLLVNVAPNQMLTVTEP